ncbi:SDR family oxidoreductase [Streptomyces lasiicapitis]|uniref:SDR family oxidoreductase n=1 Tax=Streptomyces lasiicapitis TaxID=1923961 RepID=UPI0036A6DABC
MTTHQAARRSGAGRTVVITGASSGLGQHCALHLERHGFRVFAGVRRAEDGERLRKESTSSRLQPVLLDVTDENSVRDAAATVAKEAGAQGIWAVVNNAGTCVSAPLECVPPDQMRDELNTNVVGPLAVAQAFLPHLRRTRGRIVNVTSGLGGIASPYLGVYATGQFAKEGMTDALRRELRPLGVTVCLIQPGAINTPIWSKVRETGNEAFGHVPGPLADLYRPAFERFLQANEARAQASRTRPEDFARGVRHALTATRPKTRYRIGPDAQAAAVLSRLLPDRALDRCLSALTKR